jgi:transcriptional regulator with XRE-family HTH domain
MLKRMATSPPARPHQAAEFFGHQLRALMSEYQVRSLNSGKVRKLTPLGLHRLIHHRNPDLGTSPSQIYRYFHGERVPRVDEVSAIADLFGVSPRFFVAEDTETTPIDSL